MIRHQASIHLDCSAADVFAFLAEPDNLPRWQSNLVSTDALSAGPVHQGSRFREVRMLRGKPSEIHAEVTAFDPGRRLATRTLRAPEVSIDYRLDPDEDGTRLRYEFAMKTAGLMRLMEPMIRRTVQQGMVKDLQQLKRLVEGAG